MDRMGLNAAEQQQKLREPDLVLLANSTQQTRGETSTVDRIDGLNFVGDAQAFCAEDTRSQESVPIGAAPEDSKDGADFPPAWFALLPVREILPSFNDLELLIHSWRRPQGTNGYELEYRNKAGDLLLAKFPYENQWHTTDAITRRIGHCSAISGNAGFRDPGGGQNRWRKHV